jgi:hypothetical protein
MSADLPLIILVLAVGGFIGVSYEKFMASVRRERWRKRNGGRGGKDWRKERETVLDFAPKQDEVADKKVDSADQLRTVMAAHFTVQPLLNKSEARLFKELDRLVIARHPDWQVMAQVSLGEILRTKDKAAYGCVNSKRVDLLLVDGDYNARHAIEYQGGGHYLTDAAARDAVKKEALRTAGIGYHEVVAGHTTLKDLRALVEKVVPSV